ncbi:MAG: 50S ribosomal protein L6 [Chlamydiales bacterium]
MSRKGKLPIPLPKGVEVKVSELEVFVKGPKGSLHQKLVPGINVKIENDEIIVSKANDDSELDQYHGLYRTLIFNMVEGTTKGFERQLEMIGVGYRAAVQGDLLDLQLGFSHPTKLPIPKGLTVKVDKNTLISISGHDKHLVGQFAAIVRSMRPPEPYQGKGIRYAGEYVRKKAGKAAAKK